MENTKDNKGMELKNIPRNPNKLIKDDEVDALLKKAAEQIAEKEKKAGTESAEKKEDEKSTVGETTKIPEFKKREDEKRENINLKSVEKEDHSKKKSSEHSGEEPKTMKSDKKTSSAMQDEKKSLTDEKADKKSSVDEKLAKKKSDDGAKVNFKVEDDIYVTKKPERKKLPEKSYKMTVGDVVGSVFEGIWTGIKLVVLVTLVTAIVGFLMSRDMLIRGRSGEIISKKNMNVAVASLSNETAAKKNGKTWSQTVKMKKLTLEADDGKILIAQQVIVNKKSDKWVVILHGQNGKVDDIYDIGLRYASEGFNVLMPDLRAHGESEGSFYGMGWLDRLDVINWIDVILKEYPKANVIIHGIDLGADTALMLSGEPLKDSIKAIVAEGAYTSAWDAVVTEYKARYEDWPVFPIMHMLNSVAKVWGGYSLMEADAVKQVKNTAVPILLIRGANDTFVTEDMTKELDEAIASPHEVFTIATGTHEDCRFAEPDTYYNKVFEFAEKYVK